jgi:hypothetical protein
MVIFHSYVTRGYHLSWSYSHPWLIQGTSMSAWWPPSFWPDERAKNSPEDIPIMFHDIQWIYTLIMDEDLYILYLIIYIYNYIYNYIYIIIYIYMYIYISSRNGIPHHQDIWHGRHGPNRSEVSRLQRHRRLSENPRRRNSSDTTNSVPGWDMDDMDQKKMAGEIENSELVNIYQFRHLLVMFIYLPSEKQSYVQLALGSCFLSSSLLDFTSEWEI